MEYPGGRPLGRPTCRSPSGTMTLNVPSACALIEINVDGPVITPPLVLIKGRLNRGRGPRPSTTIRPESAFSRGTTSSTPLTSLLPILTSTGGKPAPDVTPLTRAW